MSRLPSELCRKARYRRRGLTFAELLVASTILALLAGTLATLSLAVQQGADYTFERGLALQHARAVADRLEQAARGAFGNARFPGMIVVSESIDDWTFPDTLVVWKPNGVPAQPEGLPLLSELVVFSPDPADPGRLKEWTFAAHDGMTAPEAADRGAWSSTIQWLKSDPAMRAVELTSLLRVARLENGNAGWQRRGCVRFDILHRPHDAELAAYRSGKCSWASLPWPQDLYGSRYGLRQTLCQVELQLRPGAQAPHEAELAVPYILPLVIYYRLTSE